VAAAPFDAVGAHPSGFANDPEAAYQGGDFDPARGYDDHRSFFFRGRDGRMNLRAQNLIIFLQIAEGIDDDTWLFVNEEVVPVDAQMTARAPSSLALVMAMVMPRSLKEPVGLAPSTLRYTSQPTRAESSWASTSGVPPSPRVTTSAPGVTGSRPRYSSITPRH
jgi:hypothetical protein